MQSETSEGASAHVSVRRTSRGMQRDILTAVEEGSREAERSLNLPEIRRETRWGNVCVTNLVCGDNSTHAFA